MHSLTSNGAVIYSGPSLLEPEVDIVAIATGLKRPTSNAKTGDMIQTWILRQDVNPHHAAHNGQDSAICGDCPLSKLVSVSGIVTRRRRCYVKTEQAPSQIWKCWRDGKYAALPPQQIGKRRMVRIGAYGDPLAVPYRIWRDLVSRSDGWAGYTHSWRQRRFWRFRRLVMASCETHEQHLEAKSRGWRTFQTTTTGPQPDQVVCPNTTHNVSCADCGLCCGASMAAKSIVIPPHGGKAILSA